MADSDEYVRALRNDAAHTDAYHRRSVTKTEQQKFLEVLLGKSGRRFERIADIACGGGALSFHLRVVFPDAQFTLCDRDEAALAIASELNGVERCAYVQDDIHSLSKLPDDSFDLVCCWQTLSWIKEPERAVEQLLRVTKPGGVIYSSSLFNLDHDVDINAQVRDRTRASGAQGHWYDYNTFSKPTVEEWLKGRSTSHRLHPFVPAVDFTNEGRGIGTFTVHTDRGRLQISGGLLMNWAILEITK